MYIAIRSRWMLPLTGALLLLGSASAGALPVPNDPGYASQSASGGALAVINYPQALIDIGATPLQDVPVAALDTGVDLTHPDLASRLVTFAAPVTVAPFAGDGSNNGGTAPAGSHGWNFLADLNDNDYANLYGHAGNADPSDPNSVEGTTGHGTAVTGLMAAASGNGLGGVGVAPNARILAIRSCWDGDNCPGFVQPQAIQLAAAQGVRVISTSWNMAQSDFDTPKSGSSKAAVEAASNTLFVALAGGNGGPDLLPDSQRPCGLSSIEPNVICVSTSSPSDGLDCGEVSPTIVDLAVPTENNYTTVNGGAFAGTGCATSYASPTLAGAAAILFGLDPSATPAVVKAALMDSARKAAAWTGKSVTGGVLDLDAAVKLFAQRRHITLEPDPAITTTTTTSTTTTTTTTPTPLRCTLRLGSRRVLLPSRRHKRAGAGAATLLISCDRAATVTLTGGFDVRTHRSHRQFTLRPMTVTVAAGVVRRVSVRLPGGAITALARRAHETAQFALAARSGTGLGQAHTPAATVTGKR